MLRSFGVSRLIVILSFSAMTASLTAYDCCDSCNRVYVGAFGGGIYSTSSTISQMGTAFFTEAEGGPLAVYALGDTDGTSSGFGGVQLGYEWSGYPLNVGCAGWALDPAIEIEGYWYKYTKEGHLINPTDRLPEHDFLDSFDITSGVCLFNVLFSLNNPCFGAFSPYVGGGIGATRISITNATSLQTDPPELGINHFNSEPSDSSWAFAAQIKAGVRYNFCKLFHVFGEYRYLFVDSSNYIFGSTVYPAHPVTSPWNVKIKNIQFNAFVFGIQYDL